jgi:hypothetical protein
MSEPSHFTAESPFENIEPLVPTATYDSDDERRILSGMLQFGDVIQNVRRFRQQSKMLFRSKIANQFTTLVLSYYEKYNCAPADDILRFLESAPPDVLALAESLPQAISNQEIILDITEKHFQEVQLEQHTDTVRQLLSTGNVKAAQEIMSAFTPIQKSQTSSFDLFNCQEIIQDAFSDSMGSLIKFDRQDEAAFYGNTFAKDSFVLVLAGEKGKKSFFLMDFTIRAVEQDKKVAYFECGDLSRNQLVKRFVSRIGGIPSQVCGYDFPHDLDIIEQNKIMQYNKSITHKECKHPLNAELATKAIADWLQLHNSIGKMRISIHANTTQSVDGINAALDEWAQDGWLPDFVVIDYADLLKPDSKSGTEPRHQLDGIYRQLRRLSQEKHCCVLTATQASKEAGRQPYMSREFISEAKTKLAHVTACLGLHANIKELEENIIKVNHVVRRDGACYPHLPMYCASVLEICQPAAAVFYPYFRENPTKFPQHDVFKERGMALESDGTVSGGDFGAFSGFDTPITDGFGEEPQSSFFGEESASTSENKDDIEYNMENDEEW